MPNILIITNYFYPKNAIASYRMNAFAKYFRNVGFEVTVLTGSNETAIEHIDDVSVHYLTEKTQFNFKQGENRLVHYAKIGLRKLRLFLNPDLLRTWTKSAIKEGMKIVEHKKIDIVLSSYGEASAHSVALAIKEKYRHIKWIADMRDEMSQRPNISFLLKKRLHALELKVLSKADLVTSVSKPLLDEFKKIYPLQKNFLEIRNGYDHPEVYNVKFCDQFTLLYTGNFYGKRKPYQIFNAIENLVTKGKLPKNMKFDILGNVGSLFIPKSLNSIVHLLPKVSHEKAIEQMQLADVLVVIHPSDKPGVFTGKVFDYLPSNKIILSLTDPSDVIGELLTETNAGFTVANENLKGIEEALIKCYKMWENKEVLKRDWGKIRQQRREVQVTKLINYIQANWTDAD